MEKASKIILIGILAGVVIGAVFGGAFPEFGASVKFLGDIFLHALFMMVIPLVVTSMVVGITNLGDVRKLGGIGGRTIVYYMTTTGMSVLVGLILVNIVRPGEGVPTGEDHPEAAWTVEGDVVKLREEALTRLFDHRYEVRLGAPDRPVAVGTIAEKTGEAAREIRVEGWKGEDGKAVTPPASGKGVVVALPTPENVKDKKGKTMGQAMREMIVGLLPKNLLKAMVETDVLPIIIFSLFFGMVLTTFGDRAKGLIDGFNVANDVIMKMIHLIMFYAPLGIAALVAGRLGEAGGWGGFMPELLALGKYALTVIGGLLIHGVLVLPLLLWFFTRRAPHRWFLGVGQPLLTAFSTASSSATLPMTMDAVERSGVSNRSASFVLPLGATINMDGTALYEAVAAMFIAQVYGIELTFAHQVIIFLTATLAAVGAAGIPEAGLVTMVIVLTAVGLPVEGIALLTTIDWFLDRCRTTVNVWGDTIGAAIIDAGEAKRSAAAAS